MKQKQGAYRSVLLLSLPIALQNLLSTAVSSADVIMLNFVSQEAIAAVSLASQVTFILNLFFMGLTSGTGILAAQYWGRGETAVIEKITGIALRFTLGVSGFFALAAILLPELIMGIFTPDQDLIRYGVTYLRIVGISYLLMGISQIYLAVLKSVEQVKRSTLIGSSALIINIVLNAVFIFGLFGLPRMGVMGVALATTIARAVELIWCLCESSSGKRVRIRFEAIFQKNKVLLQDFITYAFPITLQGLIFGSAFTMYSAIMGHLNSDMVAANSIASTARNLALVYCQGIASGSGIYLGKVLGMGKLEQARKDGWKICKLVTLFGVIGGLVILLAKPLILNFVSLTPAAHEYLSTMLNINSYYVVGSAVNTTVMCGIFCAGGDSKFGLFCDSVVMWGISLPLSFLCAFVFKIPPIWVYFVICLDEFWKLPFVIYRYKRYNWLRNITREEV